MYSNPSHWRRLRKKVLTEGQSIRSVAKREGVSRYTLRKILTLESPPEHGGRQKTKACDKPAPKKSKPTRTDLERRRWQDWLYEIERGHFADAPLAKALNNQSFNGRKIVLAAMAREYGFTIRAIAEHLNLSRNTVRSRLNSYDSGGVDALLGRKARPLKSDDDDFIKALFRLLHEPPSLSGYNRTSWRMDDLREALAEKGFLVGKGIISQAIRKAGYRWRSAKVVLTSTDPEYREKLERLQTVLSNLSQDERFFSIDEFGPFAVKAKPGRVLAGPGVNPSVPQWQKSKGWLIVTAAIELSHNQITHFYSRAKNTQEMIKMAEKLLEQYAGVKTLYLSWDAASWHMSRKLLAFVEGNNSQTDGSPRIELVPLPASAQFLNVIESVFSGMARAIIHNSDYQSVTAAKDAIDRYISERNRHYTENPKRAGRKIWGKERTEAAFDLANNCKDPTYR